MAVVWEFAKYPKNKRNKTFQVGKGNGEFLSFQKIGQLRCLTPEAILEDIVGIPENAAVRNQLWRDFARPFLEEIEEGLHDSTIYDTGLAMALRWLPEAEDDDGSSDDSGSDLLDSTSEGRETGLRLAIASGSEVLDWSVQFRKAHPLLLNSELKQGQWQQCRAGNSVAKHRKEPQEAYMAVVQKLNPHLDELEERVDAYQTRARRWTNSKKGGKPALEALGLLNVLEGTSRVYAKQDKKAASIEASFKGLGERTAHIFEEEFRAYMNLAAKKVAKKLRDPEFNDALMEFLLSWDPSDHYYWHTQVANSVGAPTKKKGKSQQFDQRLFDALTLGMDFVASNDALAEEFGEELQGLLQSESAHLEGLRAAGKLDARNSHEKLTEHAQARYEAATAKESALAPLLMWTGYISSFTGNFEGPPSVLSLILTQFSKSDHFTRVLTKDSWLKAFMLIGISADERDAMTKLIRRGRKSDLSTARRLFTNGSWRSKTLYSVYSLFAVVFMVHHAAILWEAYKDKDRADYAAAIAKSLLLLSQDIANVCLIGLTVRYSRELDAFLAANTSLHAKRLASTIERLETKGARVVAVRALHVTLSAVGLVLNVWDAWDSRKSANKVETVIMVLTVGASLMTLIGTVLSHSWLGPAGFIAGLILGIVLAAYAWFRSGMDKTMGAFFDQFKDSTFYSENKQKTVKSESFWLVFAKNTSLENIVDDVEDEIDDFDWDTPWKDFTLDYHHAGLNVAALSKIYETSTAKIHKRLKKAKEEVAKQARAQRKSYDAAKIVVERLTPREGVKLFTGASVRLRVAVFNCPMVNEVLLEPQWEGKLGSYFTGKDQKVDSWREELQMVSLGSYKRTDRMQVFQGYFALSKVPRGGRAKFDVIVGDKASGFPMEFEVVGA